MIRILWLSILFAALPIQAAEPPRAWRPKEPPAAWCHPPKVVPVPVPVAPLPVELCPGGVCPVSPPLNPSYGGRPALLPWRR